LFNHGSGPAADPSRPAILGQAFAAHGYLFLYLFRRGAGLSADQGTNSEELMNRALAEQGQEGRNDVQLHLLDIELSDVRAGLAFLRAQPEVDARRIAVAGHSFGGQLSLLLAERDAQLRAAVIFGAAAASWDASPKLRSRLLAAVGHTSVPVFFIHAANDFSVSSGKALAEEMTRLGRPNRIKIYPNIGQTPGEGHDFVYIGLSTWKPDVFSFLDEHMRP
jgi:dienelactone hydrolase